jgi:cardiolipin synthase
VSFTWLDDRLKPNPFAGVTHTKWSVVDDLCYVFGGVNLYAEGIADNADYMFRINDKRLADTLVQQQAALLEHPAPEYPGYEGAWDGDTWYIDSGKPNDSAIYAQACLLAAKAKHILYVSQYSPSGPLARLLREHDAACYYNLPQNAGFPTNIMLRYDQYTNKIPSLYTRTKYIHAKFIIFTLPGGKKAAITGSHNFSYKGVVFGTREIALATHNADIVHQLEDFYSANIA